ncbi:hypothetical protein EMIT0P12_20088 [Pseudomonas sp. IT-P12]|uniref:HNH endonuclease n=1 Tax=Pseudomonas sp. IT-P12 TaxID=3026450 RepID=UPI0039DFD400
MNKVLRITLRGEMQLFADEDLDACIREANRLNVERGYTNGDRSDNQIENLRLVTITENNRNARLQHLNRSGLHGVYFLKDSSTYRATIGVNAELLRLGQFKSLLEAAAARKSAELKHGFHPNHGRAT